MLSLGSWSAKITKAGSESLSYPIQQFEMNGRTGDAYIAAPYGMHYNLPANQEALNISPDGTILMGIDPVGRIKVEAGEVVFYHPVTKSKIHFKNDNNIDIETSANINATANTINLNGVIIDASGNIVTTGTINADDVTADNQDVTLSTHKHSPTGNPPVPGS